MGRRVSFFVEYLRFSSLGLLYELLRSHSGIDFWFQQQTIQLIRKGVNKLMAVPINSIMQGWWAGWWPTRIEIHSPCLHYSTTTHLVILGFLGIYFVCWKPIFEKPHNFELPRLWFRIQCLFNSKGQRILGRALKTNNWTLNVFVECHGKHHFLHVSPCDLLRTIPETPHRRSMKKKVNLYKQLTICE